MQIAGHMHKVSKLGQLRARLDPLADFELWFWAAMVGGTHAVNAALHHAGVTLALDAYPTQPGVYLVPQPDGSLKTSFGELGDVLHVGRPVIETPVPPDVERMMHAMERIEVHRDPCVRQGRPATPQTVADCADALRECLELLNRRLSE
jgi:hypothetical protein